MLPSPTETDIHFILEESNRFLNRKVSRADVRAAWSGIRPLVKDIESVKAGTTAKMSRKVRTGGEIVQLIWLIG